MNSTTITILIGYLSLVKNYNETRVYNTIFNAMLLNIALNYLLIEK